VTQTAQTAEPYVPERKYLDGEPEHVWRNGKPDYTVVNQTYLAGKTRKWAADSLESLVECVVKTLEMEISHKVGTGATSVAVLKSWGGSSSSSRRVTGTSHATVVVLNVATRRC
jgi:hypothetical protein